MNQAQEASFFFRWTTWAAAAVVLFVSIIVFGTSWIPGFKADVEHKANVNSHQYVQSKKAALLEYVSEYRGLETQIAQLKEASANTSVIAGMRTQQGVLLSLIRREANLLKAEEHPPAVAAFLKSHGIDQ